jgi:S-formylglutathione hydrolase FrmB
VVPDSYNKAKCSPVLYLLHGTGSDLHPGSIEWFTGGHIDQASVPAITVVPGGGPSWWIDQWSNTARRPAWESWFWNTVMPAVNKRFNICPQRSQHTVAGLSMGGYGALYLASQRPGYFGSAASFSGVISLHRPEWTSYSRFRQLWGDPYGFYALAHDPTTLVPNLKNTRVLIDSGNGDTIGNEALDPSKRLEELEFTARGPGSTSPTRSTPASTRGPTGSSATRTSWPGTPSRGSSRPRGGGPCTPPASRATPGAISGRWRPSRARRSS